MTYSNVSFDLVCQKRATYWHFHLTLKHLYLAQTTLRALNSLFCKPNDPLCKIDFINLDRRALILADVLFTLYSLELRTVIMQEEGSFPASPSKANFSSMHLQCAYRDLDYPASSISCTGHRWNYPLNTIKEVIKAFIVLDRLMVLIFGVRTLPAHTNVRWNVPILPDINITGK